MREKDPIISDNRKLLGTFVFYLTVLVLVSYGSYAVHRESLVSGMDQHLAAIARAVPHVLPDEFDEKMFQPLSVLPEDTDAATGSLSALTQDEETDGILVFVEKDNRFYLAAFSYGIEHPREERLLRFFDPFWGDERLLRGAVDGPVSIDLPDMASRAVGVTTRNRAGDRYLVFSLYREGSFEEVTGNLWVKHVTNALVLFLGSLPVFYLFLKREEQNLNARLRIEARAWDGQRMEAVARIVGGLAHDFKNMIAVMMGAADVAEVRLKENLPIAEELEQIQQAAARSSDMIEQLLMFAREQKSSPEWLNLNDSIRQFMKTLDKVVGEDVEIVWQPDPELARIFLDPVHLGQILINLCANARDAVEGSGLMLLATENRVLDQEEESGEMDPIPPGEYVCIRVSDNGAGIAPEHLSKVCDPFFSTKKDAVSNGLGLATVYGLVKLNHGYIHIHSEPDEGTDVCVYLPAYTGESDSESVHGVEAVPLGKGETIVLVEDHDLMLDLSEQLLRSMHYKVFAFDDPGEAMKKVSEGIDPIDLLITDMVMPGMNGRELAEALSEKFPEMKKLFISGYDIQDLQRRGINAEDVHFITKPFTRGDLGTAVRRILSEDRNSTTPNE